MRKAMIAGNWKMYGLQAARAEAIAIAAGLAAEPSAAQVVIAPPFTLVADLARDLAGSAVIVGAQDCHPEPSGASTGDVSAEMLADSGARVVIVGHSERRACHGESDAMGRAKASAALRAGLVAIVCVGETLAERDAGQAEATVAAQIRGSCPDADEAARGEIVIAYEPRWAIGSGLTPGCDEIAAMHARIRSTLGEMYGAGAAERMRVLYGGSVKPANAAEILSAPDVDGALVGGASLTAREFLGVIEGLRVRTA